jgi:hypothetical protein
MASFETDILRPSYLIKGLVFNSKKDWLLFDSSGIIIYNSLSFARDQAALVPEWGSVPDVLEGLSKYVDNLGIV